MEIDQVRPKSAGLACAWSMIDCELWIAEIRSGDGDKRCVFILSCESSSYRGSRPAVVRVAESTKLDTVRQWISRNNSRCAEMRQYRCSLIAAKMMGKRCGRPIWRGRCGCATPVWDTCSVRRLSGKRRRKTIILTSPSSSRPAVPFARNSPAHRSRTAACPPAKSKAKQHQNFHPRTKKKLTYLVLSNT